MVSVGQGKMMQRRLLDGSADGRRALLSVVVPCANEEEVLRETNRRLLALLEAMPLDFEIVYVDDGSSDSTPELLRELQAGDDRVRVVRLSRNFGHQVAITAGLGYASGDAVDGQSVLPVY
jgi:dolichol-phosphate mannosyltransferase